MAEFMITLRKANGGKAVGPPRYLTFDEHGGQETFATPLAWLDELMKPFDTGERNRRGNPVRRGDMLVLVHGFNVSHESAKAFHLKCAAALAEAGWVGQLVSYDWPSDGLVFAYLPDRANARAAASALVTSGIALLEQTQQVDCTVNVHVLSHSMGGFVVQQAFTWAYQDVPPDWKVGQLIFAAADVDYTVFSADTFTSTMFARHAGRLTAYCNRYDKALLVSNAKRMDLAPRMGRVGLPHDAPSLMCEVDASALFDKVHSEIAELDPVSTHCFYFDRPEFWRDVVLTLGGGIDRSVFPTREPNPDNLLPNRYVLKPEGIDDAAYRGALGRSAASPSIRL